MIYFQRFHDVKFFQLLFAYKTIKYKLGSNWAIFMMPYAVVYKKRMQQQLLHPDIRAIVGQLAQISVKEIVQPVPLLIQDKHLENVEVVYNPYVKQYGQINPQVRLDNSLQIENRGRAKIFNARNFQNNQIYPLSKSMDIGRPLDREGFRFRHKIFEYKTHKKSVKFQEPFETQKRQLNESQLKLHNLSIKLFKIRSNRKERSPSFHRVPIFSKSQQKNHSIKSSNVEVSKHFLEQSQKLTKFRAIKEQQIFDSKKEEKIGKSLNLDYLEASCKISQIGVNTEDLEFSRKKPLSFQSNLNQIIIYNKKPKDKTFLKLQLKTKDFLKSAKNPIKLKSKTFNNSEPPYQKIIGTKLFHKMNEKPKSIHHPITPISNNKFYQTWTPYTEATCQSSPSYLKTGKVIFEYSTNKQIYSANQ